MIKFALKVGDDYLRCSRCDTFAPINLYGATLYGSRQGANIARKAAYRTFPKIDVVKVNLEIEEV